jgi:site-specific recombinase XerD
MAVLDTDPENPTETPMDHPTPVPATPDHLDSAAVVPAGLGALDRADRNPYAVYLASLAPGSRRTMAQALRDVASLGSDTPIDPRDFPWWLVRHPHAAAIRAALAERHQAATANKMLAALRGVLKAAWRLGLMSGEDYQRAIDVPAVQATTLPRGRALDAGEIRALFAACADDRSPAGRRDAALCAVLYGAGLRRSEAAALERDDLDTASGQLKVRGKGNKERLAYLSQGGRQALDEWLLARGAQPGPLFVPIRKGGILVFRRMSEQAVYNLLAKRARQAGLAHLSPHDLRRSFVGDLLDAGADVSLVQQLAGHANVQTTLRYDRRPEHAKRRAAELLVVPFVVPAKPKVA